MIFASQVPSARARLFLNARRSRGSLKARRNIVEQDGEGAHAGIVKAPRFAEKDAHGAIVAKVQSLAGVKTVDEIDLLFLCSSNQQQELTPLRRRVRSSPKFAVIGIVFGRVEIGVHPPRRAEFEQPPPVRHRPRRTEEAFDDAAAVKSFGGVHAALISHSNAGVTRLRSLIGVRRGVFYAEW